jgi:peptidyl-tRNA hydrolase
MNVEVIDTKETLMDLYQRYPQLVLSSSFKNKMFSFIPGSFQGDINTEKVRIEQKFRRMREEKMKHVMSNLSSQERMRIDDMIDRQTQEMLQLIDQKVS